MSRAPKKIVVRPNPRTEAHWGEADDAVERYLDRAGDDAWCEVWFAYNFGYRAGNPDAAFPPAHPLGPDEPKKSRRAKKESHLKRKRAKRERVKRKADVAPTPTPTAEAASVPESNPLKEQWLSQF